jgi:GGDEF domain-containing protein
MGHHLNISSSTGIAVYPEHGTDENTLVKNADIAMYYAKSVGRDNVKIFQAAMK